MGGHRGQGIVAQWDGGSICHLVLASSYHRKEEAPESQRPVKHDVKANDDGKVLPKVFVFEWFEHLNSLFVGDVSNVTR